VRLVRCRISLVVSQPLVSPQRVGSEQLCCYEACSVSSLVVVSDRPTAANSRRPTVFREADVRLSVRQARMMSSGLAQPVRQSAFNESPSTLDTVCQSMVFRKRERGSPIASDLPTAIRACQVPPVRCDLSRMAPRLACRDPFLNDNLSCLCALPPIPLAARSSNPASVCSTVIHPSRPSGKAPGKPSSRRPCGNIVAFRGSTTEGLQ
jgi:hypothetical protein